MNLSGKFLVLRAAKRPFETERTDAQGVFHRFPFGGGGSATVGLDGGAEVGGIRPEQLLASEAKQAQGIFVALDEHARVDVEDDDRFRGVLDESAIVLLALSKGTD